MAKPPPLVRARPAKPPEVPSEVEAGGAKPPRPKTSPDLGRTSIPDLDLGEQQRETAQKNLADDLAQVEAAMAALEGRDPTRGIEVAYARRDAERVRVQLQSVVEQGELHVAANEKRRRWLAFGGALGAVLVIALVAGGVVLARERAAETSAIEDAAHAAAKPFTDAGFTRETSAVDAPVEISGASKCFVAVAGSKAGPEKVRVERGADSAEGTSVAFCLCGDVKATVIPLGGPGVAVDVSSVPAAKVGGADLLPELRPSAAAHLAESDDRACAEWAIDALIESTPSAEAEAPTKDGARLVQAGFAPATTSARDASHLRLAVPPGRCAVAIGTDDVAPLSLRLTGGGRPLGVGARAVGLCDIDGQTISVWPKAKGRLDAFTVSFEAVGGLVGLTEALHRAGFDDVAVHRTEKAIAAEPRASLLASGASPAHLVDGGGVSLLGSADPPYLFAFAASEGRAAPPISSANAACSPPLASSPAAAVCLGDRALFEDARGTRASRPEWLRVGADAASVEAGLTLMAIARRMHASGLLPTPPIGATMTAAGVDVVGRPNESTVAGVIIADAPPYVHTLSDGDPWTPTGDPRVMPLAPGAKLALAATPRVGGARANASIVLFRK